MLNRVCRNWFLGLAVFAFALAVLTCFALTDNANAAEWRKSGEDLKYGTSRIYYNTTGPSYTGYGDGIKSTYKIFIQSKNGTSKKIFSVKAFDVNLCGYYNKKLYYAVDATGSEPGSLYVYDSKTNKNKRIIKYAYHFTAKGRYLIGLPNSGSWGPTNLYSVNMTTAKAKKISSTGCSFKIKGSKVYYLQSSRNVTKNGNFKFRVMRCNLNASGKKALTKIRYGNSFSFIGSNTVEYYNHTASNDSIRNTFKFKS